MGAFALTFELFPCFETNDQYDYAVMEKIRNNIMKDRWTQQEKRKLYINKAISHNYHDEDEDEDEYSDSEFDYESDIDVLETPEENKYFNKQLKNTTDTNSFYILYQ